ncbi:D-glycero-beta-D-manno-heptose 1-phosphate adenylyltransferase [uncultured Brachyspira sp.]|uniref:D-glycero-beta-D-manno-heptose 1-phosphate adenylyltransferase n=1 Tax=uncultured Brachyspira sp. TaxID=221953 RepID=UPI00259BD8E7|nr:D-glycero-beta-D-manno-heptose 1-phosphate adenylyltransferase [uncultured Brachyspira sp.]
MNKKILNIEELKRVLNIIRNKKNENQKIVFTNGCFDILHRGHVEYLQKARELGDLLILGLNSDLSVKKLKGENRPINNEEDRAIVLSALECVDYITIFNEDTPFELIKIVKPDILVKGGDYKIENVVGREFAKETILIDFVDGYSTTKTIKNINKNINN